MKTKTLIVLAPVKDADRLKASLVMNFGDEYPLVFADSFTEAELKDNPTVILILPADLPLNTNDKIVIQTHDIGDIGRATAKLLENGTDVDVTEFNRRMFKHQRLVAEITTGAISHRGLSVTSEQTGVGGYENLFREHYQLDFVKDETDVEVKDTSEEIIIEDVKPTDLDQEQPVAGDAGISTDSANLLATNDVTLGQPIDDIEVDNTRISDLPVTQTEGDVTLIVPTEKSGLQVMSLIDDMIKEPLEHPHSNNDVLVHLTNTQGQDTKMSVHPELTNEHEQPELVQDSKPIAPAIGNDDDFDPISAAFANSIDTHQASEAVAIIGSNKETPAKSEEIFDRSLDAKEKPDYPEVDHTVDVNKNILTESKNPQIHYFSDWGGSSKTYNREAGVIDYKVEDAMRRKIRPRLNDFEAELVRCNDDAIANEELHKQQYIAGARWSGVIATEAQRMPVITPIKNPDYGDTKYVGEDAVSLIQNRMKIGCKLGVYLPHTGIYFIVNSPGDDALLDTLSLINNFRVEALRDSSGILLGNSNFYLYRQVLTLFIDNVSGCSLVNWNKEVLLSLIDERDMNIISTSLSATIHPDGYEYRQVCGLVKDGKTCQHITSKLLDLRRLVFVDNSRLSEAQRNLAVSALRERSISEITNYQQANYIGFKQSYEITNGIHFVYKAQPINTVIEAGEKWIKEIEAAVDSIITFSDDAETRNTMIRQRIALTRIREYSHWIVEIQIDGDTNVITDRAKINQLINSFSRSQEVLDKVSETLSDFQRKSQIAIVAVPRVPCSVCQATDQKDFDISPHLIPQDATSRFFTLVRHRLS